MDASTSPEELVPYAYIPRERVMKTPGLLCLGPTQVAPGRFECPEVGVGKPEV